MTPAFRTGLGTVVAATALAALAAPASVTAAAAPIPNAAGQGRLDLTVRFLQDHQNLDGGWGGRPGGASDPGFSAWVAMALAAGGVNPMDQKRPDGGADAYGYLAAHAGELKYTTDFERVLLVAVAAGAPVRDFGGVDLVQRILDRRLPDGSFRHDERSTSGAINDTAFAILPLSTIDDPALRPVIDAAADWLLTVQADSGGWSYNPNVPFGVSSDMTASVIEALRAAGRGETEQERAGWRYLDQTHLRATGGFSERPKEPEANTASTAWTVQGMWAAGIEPATYGDGPPGPLGYMAAMQDERGMIRWKASTVGDRDNPIWMTAYCAPAFAGYPLPIPKVARATPVESTPATTPDEGVTAGGGGAGAPLFSKPEPQSQGQTAGGVRATTPTADQAKPRDSTKRRRARTEATEDRRTTSASNGDAKTGVTRDAAPDPSPSPAAPAAADATPTPVPSPTPATPSAGLAGVSPGDGAGAAGAGAPPQVRGDVIGAPRQGADGSGDEEAAAPGLRTAPDRAPALAAGLAVLLLLAIASGMNLERQRVAGAA